jgi:hypothetical protein
MGSKFVVSTSLPHAGLGNMLLVWARAVVFAELNSLPLIAPNWQSIHIGPWLRKERCKRYYGSFFSAEKYQNRWIFAISGIINEVPITYNPPIEKINLETIGVVSQVFLFDKMPPWDDYFKDLKEHHALVKEKLYGDIHKDLLNQILQKPSPEIGIHIRRGDYQSPQIGDDFAVRRYVFTPLDWYVSTLKLIRKCAGYDIPVTVFSDGYAEELRDILVLPNVSISPETSAIFDMITMSRSKILIASAHSSFSAWASYLCQCPTIWYSDRAKLYKPIFTNEVKEKIFEGGIDPCADNPIPELLKENISQLFS